MAQPSAGPFRGHWHHFVENFQTSPLAFYQQVEAALLPRQIPDGRTSRVDYLEGGVASARREYLRISRGTLRFDVCAAPFGTGFFFSWWLTEAQFLWGIVLLLFLLFGGIPLGLLILLTVASKALGAMAGIALTLLGAVLGAPFVVYLFVTLLNARAPGWDGPVMLIPVVGPLWEGLFRPHTFYKADTTLMFQEAVGRAVVEVVDGLLVAKGQRGLNELERKPILQELLAR